MLTLGGIYESARLACMVQVEPYDLITFRTQAGALGGVRYIRLGNFHDTLLQIIIPLHSLVVRGFTVMPARGINGRVFPGRAKSVNGLPILKLPSGAEFVGPEGAKRLDLKIDFCICVSENSVEIQFGSERGFDLEVVHKNVRFLFLNDEFNGIRLGELTVADIRTLCEGGRL